VDATSPCSPKYSRFIQTYCERCFGVAQDKSTRPIVVLIDYGLSCDYTAHVRVLFRSLCVLGILNIGPLAMNGLQEVPQEDKSASPKTNQQDKNALVDAARADSSETWVRVRAVVNPGTVGGAAYTGYTTTNMSAAEIEKVLTSKKFGFKPHAARLIAPKVIKFVRKTKVKGVFLVVAVFEGVVSAYNLIVDPHSAGVIPYSKSASLNRTGDTHEFPTISAGSEEAYLASIPRRSFLLRNGKYIIAGIAAGTVLIVYLVLRRRHIL
jgi:hypothetical protein